MGFLRSHALLDAIPRLHQRFETIQIALNAWKNELKRGTRKYRYSTSGLNAVTTAEQNALITSIESHGRPKKRMPRM